jgi:hypothetical protein
MLVIWRRSVRAVFRGQMISGRAVSAAAYHCRGDRRIEGSKRDRVPPHLKMLHATQHIAWPVMTTRVLAACMSRKGR